MERLSMMGLSNRAIVGEPAPRFDCPGVVDGRLKNISLRHFLDNNQWTILIFFPMAFSFICPTEIYAFDYRQSEFTNRGCVICFASTDSEHVLKAWSTLDMESGGLGGPRIPLISDRNHKLSKDYGVLVEEEGIAQRASFVIDPKGIIRSCTVYDANVGRSVDEARRLLDALKFTEEFGEGCPVDWKVGQKGIRTVSAISEEPEPEEPKRPTIRRGTSWSLGSWTKSSQQKEAQQQQSHAQRPTTPTSPTRPRYIHMPSSLGPGGAHLAAGNTAPSTPTDEFGRKIVPTSPAERPKSLLWSGLDTMDRNLDPTINEEPVRANAMVEY